MNINEIEDDIMFEMSNFNSRTTGLPANIVVWCRTDLQTHGHSRYRVKITKDNEWSAIYTVGAEPKLVKNIDNKLTTHEQKQITSWISRYSSLLISLIDGKIDSGEFAITLQKLRNE